MSEQSLERAVGDLVGAAIAPSGLVVDDLRITRAGKRRVVRIAVDDDLAGLDPDDDSSPVPPITLDAVADATRLIDRALDDSDVLGQAPYVLEVTSPGTSRPLSLPRHYRRNVGRLVRLTVADGGELTGRLVAAGPDGVSLATGNDAAGDGAPAKGAAVPGTTRNDPAPRFVGYAAVSRAQVQVEFTRAGDDAVDDEDDEPDETD